MARMTTAGRMELLGRIDNLLKIGGRKVNPAEIEMILTRHPDVAEAAVVAVDDAQGLLEHRLHAFVVASGADETVLRDHCRQHMPEYKVPAEIHFRRSLPKSPMGKILRRELIA